MIKPELVNLEGEGEKEEEEEEEEEKEESIFLQTN